MSVKRQINIGIIGQGRSGRDIHAANLTKISDKYNIAAVCELSEERRTRAQQELGCNVYECYTDMVEQEKLDLIVNASFSYMHTDITKDLLMRGQRVVCEKPAASSVSDFDAVVNCCPDAKDRLFFFQQSRFAPYYQKVKEIVSSGLIGEIIQASVAFNGFARRWDWQTLQRFMAGNLLNTGPHPLDQILDLYGGDENDIPEIFCAMNRANTLGDAEDYVKLVMRGKNHIVLDVEISSCCAFPNFTYNIHGTRGGIKSTMEHAEWKYFIPSEAPFQTLVESPLCKPDGTPSYCVEQLKWYSGEWNSTCAKDLFEYMALAYYDSLYNTLTEGIEFPIKLWQIRRQVMVIEECHRQNAWMWGADK